MGSPVTLSHLTLSDPEKSKLRCRIWSKIDTCIVRYCVGVNPDFNWFSLQQWVFDTSLQKIAKVIPTAAVKQSAKVLGPLVLTLLDYVSRASWNRNSSVVREWHRLTSEVILWISFKFYCCFPWAICPDIFYVFFFLFLFLYKYFFVVVTTGPYGSEYFKTILLLQIKAESFQTFHEFSY